MNIYKISCYSDCGSYFASYLQSITVAAESKEDAIQFAKDWMKKEGREFIKKDSSKWEIDLITKNISQGIIDWNEDSDY